MSLKLLLQGQYDEWRGLPIHETLTTLAADLQPVTRVHPAQDRTRTYQRFKVTVFERATRPHMVEAWVLFGDSQLSIVEYDDPPAEDLEATLEHYGAPELLLTERRLAVGLLVKEHVYASRGINFSVGTPVEAGERQLIHVQLFPATSIEFYLTDIDTSSGVYPKTNYQPGDQ